MVSVQFGPFLSLCIPARLKHPSLSSKNQEPIIRSLQ